ncbi:hypothetical protein D3C87_2190880 [compost metagenome]
MYRLTLPIDRAALARMALRGLSRICKCFWSHSGLLRRRVNTSEMSSAACKVE